MKNQNFNHNTQNETAVIVGASLSGLMTGIALAREGILVTILEKAGKETRSGAGLQVDGGMFDRTKTAKRLRKLASEGKKSIQLWSSIESRLRKEAELDGRIQLFYEKRVVKVQQDSESAWVITNQNETFHADILIGADGHRSLVRKHIDPENPDATFAGYIVWISSIAENELPKNKRPNPNRPAVSMFNSADGFLFGSVMEVSNNSSPIRSRRVGCTWYDNTRNDLLRRLGCVEGTTVKHSIDAEDIPEEDLNAMAAEATLKWPEPWLTATLHAIRTRKFTGTPIKEYIPDNLTKGRVALVGDAAHVPAPITASGFNESLQDAVDLGKCVTKGIKGNAAFKTLEKYESNRLNKVRQMVLSGHSFTQSFGRK